MIKDDLKKILVTEEQIAQRCKELGEQLDHDYADRHDVLFVGILKGSIPFMAELIKHIDLDIQFDFMDVTSYSGTESTGEIRILKDLETPIKGRHILIVEDIIDTGKTLKTVCEILMTRGAAGIKIVTLLNKPSRRESDIEGDYVGFDVPNEFVIGFGLDFNQKYRCLPYVGVLKEECYK